jgi:hypothetical protein
MDRHFICELSRLARSAIAAELTRGLVTANKLADGYDPVTEAGRGS